MPNLEEHVIQNQIRLWCGEHGYTCFRTNSGKAWNGNITQTKNNGVVVFNARPVELLPEGFSDLICFGPNGKTYFIEVKAPNKYQRPAQRKFQTAMQKLGFTYIVARSVNDVKKVLEDETGL